MSLPEGAEELVLKTKYFGSIEIEESDVLTFPKGLFAFEDEKKFVLLPFEGSDSALLCLQSAADEHLAFVVMNPFAVCPQYAPVLQAGELEKLGVADSIDLCYYVMCVVRDPVADSTLNLKCPVVINDQTRQAMQVILEGGDYHMRHRLEEFGGAPC